MNGLEDLKLLYDTTRNTMTEDEFRQVAKDNFYSDEDINSVIGANTPVAVQPQVSVEPTPQPQYTKMSIADMKNAYRGKVDLRKQKDWLKQQGYTDEELKELDNTFEVMNDDLFESFVDDLANGKSFEDIGKDLTMHFAQDAQTQEDIEAAATEAARLIQNFKLTRMLKNKKTMFSEDFGKAFNTSKLKELFPDLSEADLNAIKETDLTPSFIDALSDWSGVGIAINQDWLGVKKALSKTGIVDFTPEEEAEIQQLAKEAKKREIRENAWLGLDSSDASPLMLASMISSVNPFVGSVVGGTLGYAYSLGQGESDTQAKISAGLGAATPWVFKLFEKVGAKLLKKSTIPDEQAIKDIKDELGDMSSGLLSDVIDFANKIGYKVNIGSIVPKESNTYNIARTAMTYSKIFGQMGDNLNSNYIALDKATKKTLEELNNNPVLAKLITKYDETLGLEKQVVDDPISNLLKANLTEAQTKLANDIKKTYSDFSVLASDIPLVQKNSQIIDDILAYRDNIHQTLEGTPAEKFKQALDNLVVKNFETNLKSFTLNDLEELSKSVGNIAKSSKDPEILEIKTAFRSHLTDLKIKRLEQIKDAFINKAEKSPLDDVVVDKIDKALEIQYKAKELYKTKRAFYTDRGLKSYIGNFVDTSGAEVLSSMLQSAPTEKLASLKTAFKFVGKEKEFQQIGKRFVIDKVAKAFETQKGKYDTRVLGNELRDLFDDGLKLELFGFDKEAVDSLRYIYNLSNIQTNFARLYHRELTTSNQLMGAIDRLLNNITDSVRGWLATNTIPTNAKLKELVKQIDRQKAEVNTLLSKPEYKEIRKKLYSATKGATQMLAVNPDKIPEVAGNVAESAGGSFVDLMNMFGGD